MCQSARRCRAQRSRSRAQMRTLFVWQGCRSDLCRSNATRSRARRGARTQHAALALRIRRATGFAVLCWLTGGTCSLPVAPSSRKVPRTLHPSPACLASTRMCSRPNSRRRPFRSHSNALSANRAAAGSARAGRAARPPELPHASRSRRGRKALDQTWSAIQAPNGETVAAHDWRRERHRARAIGRRPARTNSARSATSISKPTAPSSGPRHRSAQPLRQLTQAGRSAAGNLHGRQHRLPPGRPHGVRRPHVLRRPPANRHHPQRRAAHAGAAISTTTSTPASCGCARRPCGSSTIHTSSPRTASSPRSRLEEPATHSPPTRSRSKTISGRPSIPSPAFRWSNPATGQPVVEHDTLAQSESNFVYVGGVPVFYWPTLATDLEKPSYYIDNVRIRNDSIFGFQTLFELDAFQLFSLDPSRASNGTSTSICSPSAASASAPAWNTPATVSSGSPARPPAAPMSGHQRQRPR